MSGASVSAASLALTLLAAPALAAPLLEPPPAMVAASVASHSAPLADRMGAVSATLLGLPYVNDPMGEGQAPDLDPLARYDAFDCLTFAEEVLAWSYADDAEGAAKVRAALRYGEGQPVDYAHRRHFMELQWIPGTVADGWMRVTTAEYGETVTLQKSMGPASWAAWPSRKSFHLTDAELPSGQMRLEVLPLEAAIAAAPRIRPGSLVLTVKVDRPNVPVWTSHVSLLVPDGKGGTVLRHATKIGDVDQVRDHELVWYLEHLKTYVNWKVLGVAILEPVPR